MITQNLHTHSTYCDGKNSLEENIQAAIKSGLNILGFSSHAYSGIAEHMGLDLGEIKPDKVDSYFTEIRNLKEKYKDQIQIFPGFEYESLKVCGEVTFDSRCAYTIGSVHIVPKDNHYYSVDFSPATFSQAEQAFGSKKKFCEEYFSRVLNFASNPKVDIIGHFDLVTKFIENGIENFTNEKWYKDMSTYFLKETAKTGKIFEINTGAISRGWRTKPYPSLRLLEELNKLDGRIIISSDAHSAQKITQSFDMAEKLAIEAGFKHIEVLTPNGFITEAL